MGSQRGCLSPTAQAVHLAPSPGLLVYLPHLAVQLVERDRPVFPSVSRVHDTGRTLHKCSINES